MNEQTIMMKYIAIGNLFDKLCKIQNNLLSLQEVTLFGQETKSIKVPIVISRMAFKTMMQHLRADNS